MRGRGFNPWVETDTLEKEGNPFQCLLPGKFQGERNLAGYNPCGSQKSQTRTCALNKSKSNTRKLPLPSHLAPPLLPGEGVVSAHLPWCLHMVLDSPPPPSPGPGGHGKHPAWWENVATVLKAHGVRCLHALVGGHISPLLVACEKLGIRVVDTRHEVTAVFAADAVARLTGEGRMGEAGGW